jgi:prolyl oligopeptidase
MIFPRGGVVGGKFFCFVVFFAVQILLAQDGWLSRHDVLVRDPYQVFENSQSDHAKIWAANQHAMAVKYFADLNIDAKFLERLRSLFDVPSISSVEKIGDFYYFLRRRKGDAFASLIRSKEKPTGPAATGKIVVDPKMIDPQDRLFISRFVASPNKKMIAVALSFAGSDWRQWRIYSTETLERIPFELRQAKFDQFEWAQDSKSIFYARYADGPRTEGLGIYRKTFEGTPELIYRNESDPETHYSFSHVHDGAYQLLTASGNRESKILYRRTKGPEDWTVLGEFQEANLRVVGEADGKILVISTAASPRGRLLVVDLRGPSPRLDVVIEESDETLIDFKMTGEIYVATYLKDALPVVRLFSLNFQPVHQRATDELRSLGPLNFDGFHYERNQTGEQLLFRATGYIRPSIFMQIDLQTYEISNHPEQFFGKTPFASNDFVSRQVFYKSKDGTAIPMILNHKKGIRLDGSNPVWLYAYGGFRINMLPSFDPSYIAFMEQGGVVAIPNIRGGSEYGEDWNAQARGINRHRAFEDFEAAAEWFVREGYSKSEKIGTHGASNGGLLVAATLVRRPELFGAAIPEVGVHDLLNFSRWTVGWGWEKELGNPFDAKDFFHLLEYSPVHQVILRGSRTYPATLVMTADHDDRVDPANSFKFYQALKDAQTGTAPVQFLLQSWGGHSRKSVSISEQIIAASRRCTFLLQNLK